MLAITTGAESAPRQRLARPMKMGTTRSSFACAAAPTLGQIGKTATFPYASQARCLRFGEVVRLPPVSRRLRKLRSIHGQQLIPWPRQQAVHGHERRLIHAAKTGRLVRDAYPSLVEDSGRRIERLGPGAVQVNHKQGANAQIVGMPPRPKCNVKPSLPIER